ncbi:MAG TPA: hypothetical protein VGP17_12765 [Solirubrobacteraceae bacterium]|jgi:hypothetical protein|nr:hypothetical protein [Solirubrobacteraceae bacterium]
MEPSIPTEELKPPSSHVPLEDETIVLPAGQGDQPLRSTAAASGQHCASCGATLTPDQRYCVECGQRRGPTRPPFMEGVGQQPSAPAPAPAKKGPRFSPNTALIAGIGTLMLAMATGVLIGRTSSPSSKNSPVQYVTAPTSSTGTTGGSTSATEGSGAGSTTAKESGKGSSGKSSGSNAAAKVLGGKAPEHAVVKQGTPGKGPGYQKGKFTGKFFGGSSSKKQEEEEELGEEGGKESSEKGKK